MLLLLLFIYFFIIIIFLILQYLIEMVHLVLLNRPSKPICVANMLVALMYFAVVREQKNWINGKRYVGFFLFIYLLFFFIYGYYHFIIYLFIIIVYLFIYYYYYYYYFFFSYWYSIFSRAVGVNVEAMDAYSWPTPGPWLVIS